MLNSGPLGALVNAARMVAAILTWPVEQAPVEPFTQFTITFGGKLPDSMIEFSKSTLTAVRMPRVLSYCSEMSAPSNGWKSWTEMLMVMVEFTGALAGLGSTVRIFENAWAGVGRKNGEKPNRNMARQAFRLTERFEKVISLS